MTVEKTPAQHPNALFHDLRSLIEETRSTVATTVNAALTMLYWRIGKRVNEEVLQGERAGYGEAIVSTVSRQLTEDEQLPDSDKVTIINQLHARWTHPDSEVRNRIKLFAVRSPDILKPILESRG